MLCACVLRRMPATAGFGPDFIGKVDQVLDAAQVGPCYPTGGPSRCRRPDDTVNHSAAVPPAHGLLLTHPPNH